MWFRNLQIYRLPSPWSTTAEHLEACLASHAFSPANSMGMQNQGWDSPRPEGKLVHTVDRQMLIMLTNEKKLLPAMVVNQVAKAKAIEIEEQQGFKPGRKQMREIKEQITDELMPRAFSVRRSTMAWIDPVNGWLVIDAANQAKADEFLQFLRRSVDDFPLVSLQVAHSPATAMTNWLMSDEAPSGFTVDQDTELRSTCENKAIVRYVRHTLEAEDIRRHIAAGKQCTRLALTWSDRISFVLTENMSIKRVAPLDILKESTDPTAQNDDERFDADMMLMTGEMNRMLTDLVAALGGQVEAA